MSKRTPDNPFRKETTYEWDFETVDEHGDVEDHQWWNTLKRNPYARPDDINCTTKPLCLIRDVGSEGEGLIDRSWAYVTRDNDGLLVLPEYTDSDDKVPMKYHAELKAWQSAWENEQKETQS